MYNTRGNYSALPGTGSSWQEGRRQGWKEFSRKFSDKARWRRNRTCCLDQPSPTRRSSCPSVSPFSGRTRGGGGVGVLSWWKERDLGGCWPAQKPPSLVTLRPLGCLPLPLPQPGHTSPRRAQQPPWGPAWRARRGGWLCRWVPWRWLPGERLVEVPESGVCPLPLLPGTRLASGIVPDLVPAPPR